jgi:uncharacterized protein (DUF2147 family)
MRNASRSGNNGIAAMRNGAPLLDPLEGEGLCARQLLAEAPARRKTAPVGRRAATKARRSPLAPRLEALALAVLLCAALPDVSAQSLSGLEGTWLTADSSSKIRFEPCAAALCGRLVWLRDPIDPQTGKPLLDKNNPDPGQRLRQLLGLLIFTDMRAIHPGEWRAKAYNAEDARTYDVELQLTAPDQLTLRGCGLGGLICRSERWTRSR